MLSLSLSRLSMLAMIALATIGVVGAVYVGLNDRFGIELLREHQSELITFVTSKPLLAAVLFMTIYALLVATSMPGLAVFTMTGGYLFGWQLGAAYTMVAVMIASTCIFLLARSAVGEAMRERAGPMIRRFAHGFKESALSYVFIMQLVPVLPYIIVTTLPAACGVPLHIYVFSTFFGILPATILFSRVGAGFGDVLASDGPIELSSFLTPDITLSLAGLALLALLPVFIRAIWPGFLSGGRDR
jgi:uncharacterized membrane protein YdjX (TVP38/TMEM64 family)